jgi:hypothetical protein
LPHRKMEANAGKNDRELEVFSGFVAASRLPVFPGSIRHSPENVNEPDIICSVGGGEEYFEISEIFWEQPAIQGETLAKGLHESGRAAKQKSELIAHGRTKEADQFVTAGSFGYPPLLSIRQSLRRKISKPYALGGRPCSVLLYYDRQSPVEPYDLLYECMPVLTEMLTAAAFKTVWLYQVNAVIGRIALRNGSLFMAFDNIYSEIFSSALRQANEAIARATSKGAS